ncbi:hypothetical protein GJ744_000735 [Endocarpon pusillum]|uniref:Uncharacterized protein n=1 Tax=Endocarpon pusillum TaxID=364733 RepID=A0A8H7AAD6_9EURO|nr:hypothetical protein GJ744_000735 [Endocarpon pusillum]
MKFAGRGSMYAPTSLTPISRAEAFRTSSPSPSPTPTPSNREFSALRRDKASAAAATAALASDRRFDHQELHVPAAVAVDEQTQKQKQKQRRESGSSSSRDAADGEEEFEFRLFASRVLRAGQGDGVARVNLRSPTPLAERGEGGFVVPCRPRSYYFTSFGDGDADGDADANADAQGGRARRRRDEYRDVAVEGQEVMFVATSTAWPGAALPWRVIRVPASSLAQSLKTSPTRAESRDGRTQRRARAGKKRRIAMRKKHAAEVRAAETEKEKRARKNREKKVKKREKNRQIKELVAAAKESGEAPH